ncbi:hypothetical protein [Pseudomonas sp. B21-053]|uniref:hypothetical protein n=1 Tax=Pseudomonas sp. B21-053 TaxID=2895493 RepID=UPI00222FCA4B|nr:hypothetical protein [Pseudomonas sp. B21-053]UZE09245.1 hypothetical protein LOY68_17115 [Pseudomonas sp. B21-053]
MAPVDVLVYDAPTVIGVDENDPEGYIPLELLQSGIEVRVPIWPMPALPGQTDTLTVWLRRNGVVVFTSTTRHLGPITELEFLIPIGPQYLINDGVVEVLYETRNHFGNPHPSLPRKLTIDHIPIPQDLPGVTFPKATLHGYFNCNTVPPIWMGIEVKVPSLPSFCRVGDTCRVEWNGYLGLVGKEPAIAGTYKRIDKQLLSDQEIRNGFSVTVEPYVPHIEPMRADASAFANYSLYRTGRKIGASIRVLVKIDRKISGGGFCGPSVALNDVTSIPRITPCCWREGVTSTSGAISMNAKVENPGVNKQVSLQGSGALLFPAVIPAQNLPGGDLRIPVAALGAALRYLIPQPADEYDRDRLDVFLRLKGNPTRIPLLSGHQLGPVASRIWPLPLDIPLSQLTERQTPETPTQYELVYILYANGVNPQPEQVTEYHIDRTKPYQSKTPPTDFSPPAASFPVDLPPGRDIDDAYLGANPTGIVITIPRAAANAEATDVCNIYWGNPADPAFASPVLRDVPVPLVDGKITLLVEIFERSAEGLNTLQYEVRDLAGNLSRRSRPDQRNVRRLAPPVPLPPVVPLADGTNGDTLIDVADCKQGVTIEVPVPLPNAPSDTIIAYWQGTAVALEERVGTNTVLVFNVDYAIIKAAYGSTDGVVPTTVSYNMFRGSGAPIATEDTDIGVDIFQPGPPNPDEPDPINRDLELPRLVSSQGVNNKLDDNDFGKDADIFIQLYAAPPTESAQSITVFYDDVELSPPYLLRPGEEGTEIKAVTVPWAVIERKPNGIAKIKWRLSQVLGNNPVWSEDQDVDVNITKIDLPAPQVQGLLFDSISCPTLNFMPASDPNWPGDGTNRRNLKVIIPNSPSLLDGRMLILVWEGFTDEFGTVPIPWTRATKNIPIVGTVPPTGIETDIGDYFVNFKPVSNGFGKLTYTVSAVLPESDPAIHFVFLVDNNRDYCEVANPIPGP